MKVNENLKVGDGSHSEEFENEAMSIDSQTSTLVSVSNSISYRICVSDIRGWSLWRQPNPHTPNLSQIINCLILMTHSHTAVKILSVLAPTATYEGSWTVANCSGGWLVRKLISVGARSEHPPSMFLPRGQQVWKKQNAVLTYGWTKT